MQYIVEENLSNFKFWSGGKDRADTLTTEQLDQIGEELEQFYNAESIELTDTQINDLFWFDFEWVCGLIGLKLDDGENVIEDMEVWSKEIISKTYPDIVETYFDDFWLDQTCPHNEPDWSNKQEVLEAFEEYLSDNWLDHAKSVLEEKYPDAFEEFGDDFACEHWQNCGSDDWNCSQFEEYVKGEQEKIANAERDEDESIYGHDNPED